MKSPCAIAAFLTAVMMMVSCGQAPVRPARKMATDPANPSGAAAAKATAKASKGSQENTSSTASSASSVATKPSAELIEACSPTNFVYTGDESEGSRIFEDQFPEIEESFKSIALSVCTQLYKSAAEVKRPGSFALTLHDYDGVAQAGGGELEISTAYISSYARGRGAASIKLELEGVLFHEITHLYQNDKGIPGYFIEGIADFVRIKADKYESNRKEKGGSYRDAYTTTGYFLVYLDSKYPEFVSKMNLNAAKWDGKIFESLTGKNVDTLWDDYQRTFF